MLENDNGRMLQPLTQGTLTTLPWSYKPLATPHPQFHDGLGFLVTHSLITNTFEFSLQLVNPKLTVPYWDFTIETTAASGIAYDPTLPYTRTELLSPSWFGTADLNDHMVRGLISVFLHPSVEVKNPARPKILSSMNGVCGSCF